MIMKIQNSSHGRLSMTGVSENSMSFGSRGVKLAQF